MIPLLTVTKSHAALKHKYTAAAAHECLMRDGPILEWVNPTTGRRARVCQIDAMTFGVQIIQPSFDGWHEVTAFIKNKLTRLDQVKRYLTNAGYAEGK